MFRGIRQIAVLCIAGCGLVCAQTETRADQIEAERAQKEANLTPQEPPKGQMRLESIEDSFLFHLLTGEFDGFGVGFGNIVPGAGFAAGPQYRKTGLWNGNLTVSAVTRAAVNESLYGRVDVLMPHLL